MLDAIDGQCPKGTQSTRVSIRLEGRSCRQRPTVSTLNVLRRTEWRCGGPCILTVKHRQLPGQSCIRTPGSRLVHRWAGVKASVPRLAPVLVERRLSARYLPNKRSLRSTLCLDSRGLWGGKTSVVLRLPVRRRGVVRSTVPAIRQHLSLAPLSANPSPIPPSH